MVEMTAKKQFTYASKRLIPGEDFHTRTARDAKILTAIGKAEPKKTAPDNRAELRAEYQAIVGRKPFHGWDADTLQSRIADAKGDN